MKKSTRMYIGLLALGSLILLLANVYKARQDALDSSERRATDEQRFAELRNLLTEAQALKGGYQSLLTELQTSKSVDAAALERLRMRGLEFESAERRLADAVSRMPTEIHAAHAQQQSDLVDEKAAQDRASQLDQKVHDSVVASFETIQAAVMNAAKSGLIRPDKLQPGSVPVKTMFSAFQLKNRPRALVDQAMSVLFSGKTSWLVYVELGYVRSPAALAEWHEGGDLWFPMVRITERGDGADKTMGTVYFDPASGALGVTANDALPATKARVAGLAGVFQGQELVANAVVELLKETSLRIATAAK